MFSLKLLGGVLLEGPAGPLAGRVSQRRRLALLSVLALSRERPVSRDRLLALFWPESESERARHSLADSLYQIRRELGEGIVLSMGEDVWLDHELISSDVAEFEGALGRGEPRAAVSVYSGPFLDGFHLSDAPEFERWLDRERERLARAHAAALEQLAEEATAQRDARSAVEWWRRLAAEDPYNGRVTLQLMLGLEALGDRAGAIRQARVHTTLLAEDFGAEPDTQVSALVERLRLAADAPPSDAGHEDDPHDEPPAEGPELAPPVSAEHRSDTSRSAARFRSSSPSRPPRIAFGWRSTAALGALVIALGAAIALGRARPDPRSLATSDTGASGADPKAVAVLPCANLSRDPEEEYFSDGLTEELIGVLSQVRALSVVARSSIFAYKNENRDVREIGRTLNVGTVVECSVRRDGERVRVTAQLIDATDGFHLWSQTYEREGTDIFAIQSDLALRIVRALAAELTPAERARLARRPTASPEAHVLYLKGRYFWNQRTRWAFDRAIHFFEQAIAKDSQYAAAYAGLASTHALRGVAGFLPPEQARERMRFAVSRALALDAELAEAHSVLGSFLNLYEWDSEGAERAHRRAIELDPSYGAAHHFYANLLRATGRFDEALTMRWKAVELDPLAPQLTYSLGLDLLSAGRLDEARRAFHNVLELDSTYWRAHAGLGAYYETTGHLDHAILSWQRAVDLADDNQEARTGLASILARTDRRAEARAMLRELAAEADGSGIYPPIVGSIHLALDDADGALAWLEQSYRQKHPQIRLTFRGRWLADLEDHPRYPELLRRARLPE